MEPERGLPDKRAGGPKPLAGVWPRIGQFMVIFIVFFCGGLLLYWVGIAVLREGPESLWPKLVAQFFPKPTFSTEEEGEPWCAEHHVPESQCVNCHPDLWPKARQERTWCEEHVVPECPLCYPEIAELVAPPEIRDDDRERARQRTEGPINPQCDLHRRVIQIASEEVLEKLGMQVEAVDRAALVETVSGEGHVELDPQTVLRICSPTSGRVRSVRKKVGDRVSQGEILVEVDSAEVARWRAELRESRRLAETKQAQVERLAPLTGLTVSPQQVYDLTTEANLALLEATRLAGGLAWLERASRGSFTTTAGLRAEAVSLTFSRPDGNEAKGDDKPFSEDGSLAIRSPREGRVFECRVGPGESVVLGQPLLTVGDSSQILLNIQVSIEDTPRVKPGQAVRFFHSAHSDPDLGKVVAVSPTIEDRTRTVTVWASLHPNELENHVGTPGMAEITVSEEPGVIVVPASAVHWEGDCFVVFVRDRDFDRLPYKVFHVRKVRVGRKTVLDGRDMLEVVAGVLPGELVATTNSFILRGALLEDRLGAACVDEK